MWVKRKAVMNCLRHFLFLSHIVSKRSQSPRDSGAGRVGRGLQVWWTHVVACRVPFICPVPLGIAGWTHWEAVCQYLLLLG